MNKEIVNELLSEERGLVAQYLGTVPLYPMLIALALSHASNCLTDQKYIENSCA